MDKRKFLLFLIGVLAVGGMTFASYKYLFNKNSAANLTSSLFSNGSASEESAVEIAAKAKTAAQLKADTASLNTLTANFVSNYDESIIGLVVTDLSDGATSVVNGDKQFVSASIYKLFVAYGVYSKIDTGTISESDSLSSYGADETVSECLNDMITISSNTCGVALGNLYGWSNLNSMLTKKGYSNTDLNNYDSSGDVSGDKKTTANDVAKLLKNLYDGDLLDETTTDEFIDLLKAQEVNDRLPTGLPDGTVIAHKTGDLYGYAHDAGIIYSDNKDMLVVMLTGEWESPTTTGYVTFKDLAERVWTYME